MKKVLVIKNIDINKEVTKHAEYSYEYNQDRYYTNKWDAKIIEEVKNDISKNNYILLMIDFNEDKKENCKTVNKLFIGTVSKVEDEKLYYAVKVYLTKEQHQYAIESILDKFDLDLAKDFVKDNYMMVCPMASLYDELHERIIAKDNCVKYHSNAFVAKDDTYKLGKLAQKDNQAIRIYAEEPVKDNRLEFQRDRERVVNCKAFRRLVDKAQIFGSEKGDYYRTRMTHSLEVNQIAKAISYALHLNLDLTEAIALGHDLGHTPFGHQGERTLDDILCGKINVGIEIPEELIKERCLGGFKHNYQSARVLTQLEEKYIDFLGLNVSAQVVEGVFKHTKRHKDIELKDFISDKYIQEINVNEKEEEQICGTLEGQVVAIADEIAQRGHDVDDALTSKVLSIPEFIDRLEIKKCNELKDIINRELERVDGTNRVLNDVQDLKVARVVSCIINYLIEKTIEQSEKNITEMESKTEVLNRKECPKIIDFSEDVKGINVYLEKVVRKKVICNSEVARADYNADVVVKTLFSKYYQNPRLLHAGTIHKIFAETLNCKNKNVSIGAVNLADGDSKLINKEIELITREKLYDENIGQEDKEIKDKIVEKYIATGKYPPSEEHMIIVFEKRRILIRAIVDYIAGMTDGYALEEYEKIR